MTLRENIVSALVPGLEARGFKKRSGEIFTIELAEGFVGWLGLNRAKHPQGIELNPVVGVRCQELEALLAMVLKEQPHKYVPPTVSISLGYLMPQQQYRSWVFRENTIIDSAADMTGAIVRYGIPFMESTASLVEVRTLLDSPRFSSADQANYRRPLVQWLLGDQEAALQACAACCCQLGQRTDPAAEHFRQFARSLESLANPIHAKPNVMRQQ